VNESETTRNNKLKEKGQARLVAGSSMRWGEGRLLEVCIRRQYLGNVYACRSGRLSHHITKMSLNNDKHKMDMMSGIQHKILVDSRTILYTILQQQTEA